MSSITIKDALDREVTFTQDVAEINPSLYAANSFTPELVLDFTKGVYFVDGSFTPLDGVVECSRTDSRTYTDKTGILQTAGPNVPRINHVWDGISWIEEGLIIDNETTNLITNSSDFSTGWDAFGSPTERTVQSNSGIAPDGTMTANLVSFASSSAILQDRSLARDFSGLPEGNYVFSIFAKVPSGTVVLRIAGGGTGRDIQITEKWTRFSFISNATSSQMIWGIFNNINNSPIEVLLWGGQLEQNNSVSSYIPVEDVPETRSGDTITIPASLLPYNSNAVSISTSTLIKNRFFDTIGGGYSWGSGDNIITGRAPSPAARAVFKQTQNGTVSQTVDFVALPDQNDLILNYAGRHTSNSVNGAFNGNSLTIDTSPTALPNLIAENMQFETGNSPVIVKYMTVWGDDIGDAGTVEASTLD